MGVVHGKSYRKLHVLPAKVDSSEITGVLIREASVDTRLVASNRAPLQGEGPGRAVRDCA